jgi:hypothetical protein
MELFKNADDQVSFSSFSASPVKAAEQSGCLPCLDVDLPVANGQGIIPV